MIALSATVLLLSGLVYFSSLNVYRRSLKAGKTYRFSAVLSFPKEVGQPPNSLIESVTTGMRSFPLVSGANVSFERITSLEDGTTRIVATWQQVASEDRDFVLPENILAVGNVGVTLIDIKEV